MIVELRETGGEVHIIKWPNGFLIPRLIGDVVEFNNEVHIVQEVRLRVVTSIPGNSGVNHVEDSRVIVFTKIKK